MHKSDPNSMPEAPIFAAVLVPQRSLSRTGLGVVLGLLGALGLAIAVLFSLLGAWPVAGFMGLDVVLIYAAFRYHTAAARAYEAIELSRVELVIRSVSARGAVREIRFNPRWTRLEKDVHPEFGIERLSLVEGRARAEIAKSLGRKERGEFARAFQRALAQSRR